MPRKAFVADLAEAAEILDIDHLSSLKAGDEDGTINFKFHIQKRPAGSESGIAISAIIPGTNHLLSEISSLEQAKANVFFRCFGLPQRSPIYSLH